MREATFNALGSLDVLDDAVVLDLFAGSGALGIEAISRGARHATFVDRDREAVRCVRANLRATGLEHAASVVQLPAETFLDRHGGRFDLALLDPPYTFDRWRELLDRLPATVAVVEARAAVDLPPGWRATRERRYGSTVVTIARRTDEARDDEERA